MTSHFKGFGSGSNASGQFWYGRGGFLYKKNGGGGVRANPLTGLICNKLTYNKYKPGTGGVGATNYATRRAKNRRATVCTDNGSCNPIYMTLGRYMSYTSNPNGYVTYPLPIP